jgi:branched-chain amino acid transport system ATP-binding protein
MTEPKGLRLELRGVHAGYGSTDVLRGVDLVVEPGEAVALLGPNGAGKSTIVNVITGVLPVRRGELLLDGEAMRFRAPHEAAGHGVAVVPEGRRLFGRQTVAENLRVGAWVRRRDSERDRARETEAVLDRFPILRDRQRQPAASLSGGEAQMLAVAMALLARPRLVVLDEPSLGLAPRVVGAVMDEITTLRQNGTSVLLVEQNLRRALRVVDRGYVLSLGTVRSRGSAAELQGSIDLRRTYLGR